MLDRVLNFFIALGIVVGLMALLFAFLGVVTLMFIAPYMLVTGDAPNILLVQGWFLFVAAITIALAYTMEKDK